MGSYYTMDGFIFIIPAEWEMASEAQSGARPAAVT